jgi:hypothetical protein
MVAVEPIPEKVENHTLLEIVITDCEIAVAAARSCCCQEQMLNSDREQPAAALFNSKQRLRILILVFSNSNDRIT